MNPWPFVNLSSIILWSCSQVIRASRFQYAHYEGITVNSDTTISIVSAGLWTHRLQERAAIGWFSLSSSSAASRACRPLTAPRLLIFSLKPLLCLCLCLFCRAFQSTLLGSTSHINATILFNLLTARRQTFASLNCYSHFCHVYLYGESNSPYRQVIILEILSN